MSANSWSTSGRTVCLAIAAVGLMTAQACSFDDSRLDELRDRGPDGIVSDVGPDVEQDPTVDPPTDGEADVVEDPIEDPIEDVVEDPPEDIVEDVVEDPVADAVSDVGLDVADVGDVAPDLGPGPCGDEVLNIGEECDEGGETANCDDDCTHVECGDGNFNFAALEECDDGDNDDLDGCDAVCDVEDDWVCIGDLPSVCFECGDGSRSSNEQCDDGDNDDDDGCSATCTIETNFNCTTTLNQQSQCDECGNGITTAAVGETCDDGDRDDCTPPCPANCGVGVGPAANACGDDTAACDELCDGSDLGGFTCQDGLFGSGYTGEVTCTDSCTLDFSGCGCDGTETNTDGTGLCDLLDPDDDDDGCNDEDDREPLSNPQMDMGLTILYIAADADGETPFAISADDQTVVDFLSAPGNTVDIFQDNDTGFGCSSTTDAAPGTYYATIDPLVYDVIWVSASCSTSSLIAESDGAGDDPDPSHLHSVDIPVIAVEGALFDNLFLGTVVGNNGNETTINVTDNDAFVSEFLASTGSQTVYTEGGDLGWIDLDDGDTPALLETIALDPVDSTRAVVVLAEDNIALVDGATATNRRVGLGFEDAHLLTGVGQALALRALLWAAGMEGEEPFIDGDDVPQDCDTCPAIYDTAQTDADGDGFGVDCDCDDRVPTCVEDCITNNDVGGEFAGYEAPDCYEDVAGCSSSDGSDCLFVSEDDGDVLADAIIAAAGGDSESIVVNFDPFTGDDPIVACPTGGVSLYFTAPLSISGNEGLRIQGESGCVLAGVEAEGSGNRVFQVQASGTTIRDFHIGACVNSAIELAGANGTVENVFIDCGSGDGLDAAGILVDATGATIVGNVIRNHADDGIQLESGSNDAVMDHNTLVGLGDNGIEVRGASTNLCVRNNLFDDLDAAIAVATSSSWDTTCANELPDATWNNAADWRSAGGGSVGELCAGAACGTNCSNANCLPTTEELFFDFSGAFAHDPGFDANECISSPLLIDAAPDLSSTAVTTSLDGYDRDGDGVPPPYVGDGPDIGGRETGAGVCQ